ncbi:hypothetical protein SAMN05216490_1095 [Mucilaginibacter mallensis]|uniref:Uncharacterized protein n=2 Tax=Sphingobacteriaceae TaxID=84566 RepID=A0A1H1RZU8_MUCMA|nr:hypothetical protein [Mucilaginibacter sp. X5P1]SDS40509.1 hypothetical protein SAMN05216490_1095 [Mucilaginibacter mallensis]
MKAQDKHFKLINSATGYVIYYHTLNGELEKDKIKEELEKVKAQVAIKNNIYIETIFWQEIKDDAPADALAN